MTDSVHSFGESPLGAFFLFFIIMSAAVFAVAMYANRENVKDPTDFNFLSREGVFFLSILCFVALTLALIFYTMLPVLTEIFFNDKMSVEQASYNLVSTPFFIVIFLLAGLAPLMSYKQMEANRLAKIYLPIFICAVAVVAFAIYTGHTRIASIVLALTAATVLFSFLLLAFKMVKAAGISSLFKNRRMTGVIIIHIGLAITAFGVIYSGHYERDKSVTTSANATETFEEYTLMVGNVQEAEGADFNYHSTFVPIQVMRGDLELVTLYPEIRSYYSRPDQVFGEVAYYSMLKGDLYIILEGYDLERNLIQLKFIFQPLLAWILVGTIIMCIGGLVGMTKR
jgi:cytochrome c-type biogenesis protein CcmF